MKVIDLLNKIANGEITEGTKIKIEGNKTEYKILDGDIVQANDFETYFLIGRKRLNDEVEIIEEKQQDRWKPKKMEHYWSIDTIGCYDYDEWLDDDADNWRYATKNVFKTKQEAEEYFEYKTALSEAEKPFKLYKKNFYICNGDGYLHPNYDTNFQTQGAIYLGTNKDVAQAFVDKWYKQIMKYEFGIEE